MSATRIGPSSAFKTLYPSDSLAGNLDDRLSDVEAALRSVSNKLHSLTQAFEQAVRMGCVKPLPIRSMPPLDRIMLAVAEKMNGGRPILLDGRQRDRVRQRDLVMVLAKEQGYSYSEIGRALHRHHSTVMHGIKKAKSDTILESVRLEIRGNQ